MTPEIKNTRYTPFGIEFTVVFPPGDEGWKACNDYAAEFRRRWGLGYGGDTTKWIDRDTGQHMVSCHRWLSCD